MNRPYQTVHIIEGGASYTFDVMIKSEHSHTMDVLEDHKDSEEKTHVRYAVRKPSTITLEVSVNDTVTISGEPLSSGGGTRSASAYENLYQMMQRRNHLTVITRMHTFTKMMMSDFVITEDPDHQNEMYANVAFKEMIVVEPPPEAAGGANNNKSKDKPKEVGADKGESIAYKLGLGLGKLKSFIQKFVPKK